MFLTCAISLVVALLPTLLLFVFKKGSALCLGLAVTLQLFLMPILSKGLLGDWDFSWSRLIFSGLLSTVVSVGVSLWVWHGSTQTRLTGRKIVMLLLLSVICNFDSFLIYARQGWHFQDWDGKFKIESYFRAPFNNDVQRNVNLVETLLRKSDNSPFLPESRLTYQTVWHEWAALVTGPFRVEVTRYPLISGVTIATSILFFFLLFLVANERKSNLVLVAILLSTHTELFNVVMSLIKSGRIGLEADWSVPFPIFFRTISLKLMGLISPQHLLFFCGAAFVALPGFWTLTSLIRILILALLLMSSPVLYGLLVIPFLWSKDLIVATVVGWVMHQLIFGFDAFSLLATSRSAAMSWMNWSWASLIYLPLLLVVYAGIPGLWVSAEVRKVFRKREFWGLFAILCMFSFAATSAELRRHAAMVAVFVCALLLMSLNSKPKWMSALAVVSLVLHGFFIYGFTLKPSTLDPAIVWKDYFLMNEYLRTSQTNATVISATSSEHGIEFPISMEAAISYDGLPGAVVHGRVKADTRVLLERSEREGVFPFAYRLGYRQLIWGPLEQKVWSREVIERFTDRLLAKIGAVHLYSLKENPWEEGGYATFSDSCRSGAFCKG